MKLLIKLLIMAVSTITVVMLALVCYRLFFMFDRKKVKEYSEQFANATGDPNTSYRLITESVESILKSQDLTKSVMVMAQITDTEKEKALVITALNQCYSNGFIARPKVIEVEPENYSTKE